LQQEGDDQQAAAESQRRARAQSARDEVDEGGDQEFERQEPDEGGEQPPARDIEAPDAEAEQRQQPEGQRRDEQADAGRAPGVEEDAAAGDRRGEDQREIPGVEAARPADGDCQGIDGDQQRQEKEEQIREEARIGGEATPREAKRCGLCAQQGLSPLRA